MQYYSGRTSSVFDVGFDFAGAVSGVLIIEFPGLFERVFKRMSAFKRAKGVDKDEDTE